MWRIDMAVNSAAAYGMYPQNVPLNEVVHTLNQAGFDNEYICMMLSPTHPIAALVRDASLFISERGTNAANAGLIGWLSEFGEPADESGISGIGTALRDEEAGIANQCSDGMGGG